MNVSMQDGEIPFMIMGSALLIGTSVQSRLEGRQRRQGHSKSIHLEDLSVGKAPNRTGFDCFRPQVLTTLLRQAGQRCHG